jgi:hypothetical protein
MNTNKLLDKLYRRRSFGFPTLRSGTVAAMMKVSGCPGAIDLSTTDADDELNVDSLIRLAHAAGTDNIPKPWIWTTERP